MRDITFFLSKNKGGVFTQKFFVVVDEQVVAKYPKGMLVTKNVTSVSIDEGEHKVELRNQNPSYKNFGTQITIPAGSESYNLFFTSLYNNETQFSNGLVSTEVFYGLSLVPCDAKGSGEETLNKNPNYYDIAEAMLRNMLKPAVRKILSTVPNSSISYEFKPNEWVINLNYDNEKQVLFSSGGYAKNYVTVLDTAYPYFKNGVPTDANFQTIDSRLIHVPGYKIVGRGTYIFMNER